MCHTLLQYYIHCSHSTTHLYPCILAPQQHRGREYIHPNYEPSKHKETEAGINGASLSSEWRDHSVPLSVAHSYHRVCPTCADEKSAKDKEQELQDRRRRGTEMWRVYSQNPESDGDNGEYDDEDHETLAGHSGNRGPATTTAEGAAQHRRAAAVDLSEQTLNDRRGAAVRIARDLGVQLLPSETVEQWEHRISAELRVRGAELVASDVNGRPVRLGDGGWEVVPTQGPIRGAPLARQRIRPRSRSRTRPAAQPAATQTTMVSPPRSTLQRSLGPRTLARQMEAERRRNPPILLTTAQEANRRTRFEQATANERRRIEEALAARDLPALSEAEVQRRLQPIRDLMSAPPMLAVIQQAVPAHGNSAAESLRARARELQRLEAEETERLRADNRQRRNALAVNNMSTIVPVNAIISLEPGAFDNDDAMEVDDQYGQSSDRDNELLPELDEIHEDSPTTPPVSIPATGHNRRSETPSPEDRPAPFLIGRTAHEQRVWDGSRLHLPDRSVCLQHVDAGWELHSDRPSHATAEEDTMKAFVMGLHNETPRTYNKTQEILVSHTCEVLVHYDGCKHVEAIFVERLYRPDKFRDTTRCGCDAFGDRLLGSRKALSRQKCIECRTEAARQRHPEQFYWLEKYVRPIETAREYKLWPFGSKCNNGVLEYR